jgi:peptidoglycan/LPS O-acetylase OafA/YrhL
MRPDPAPARAHANNAGVVRLVLASCVIIGHAPEMVDGNRHHEPMTMLFHTLSLGEMAVDGFFLLSGYLVTSSLLRSTSLSSYFFKRIMRIYPGFWLASLLVTFGLGIAIDTPPGPGLHFPLRMLMLVEPPPFSLAFLHCHALNGSMWTLAYEMRCYVFIALLFVLGFFRSRWPCVGTALLMVTGVAAQTFGLYGIKADLTINQLWMWLVFGVPTFDMRFASAFLLGATAYLFRTELDRMMNGKTALACIVLAVVCLCQPHFA